MGLVEEFNASLKLFEAATGCNGLASPHYRRTWVHQTSLKRLHPAALAAHERAFDACADELRAATAADAELYAHAKALHAAQVRVAAGGDGRWGAQRRQPAITTTGVRCTQRDAAAPVDCRQAPPCAELHQSSACVRLRTSMCLTSPACLSARHCCLARAN